MTTDGSYCCNRQHLIRMPEMEPEQDTQREHVPVEQEPQARSSRTSRPTNRYDPEEMEMLLCEMKNVLHYYEARVAAIRTEMDN